MESDGRACFGTLDEVKFSEALTIVKSAPEAGTPFAVTLACGFTPLHLATYLGAYLQRALPTRRVDVRPGMYGDLVGTVAVTETDSHAIAIAIEWSDLDSRLGYRQLGGWGPGQTVDIVKTVRLSLDRIAHAVLALPAHRIAAISLPTLPLAPVFHTPGWQAGGFELGMMHDVLAFAESLAGRANTFFVNPNRLAFDSNPAGRFDLRSELFGGLPYTLPHADAVASALARLIQPPQPKKGLITDLDGTLWHGVLGDLGPDGISWDLTGHRPIHGLYQQLLRALADEGVLLAVASKNDRAAVEQVFEQNRLVLPATRIFPMEIHWSAKSGSVERILSTWNIGMDSVVFVDDSPMEIAEVRQAHPEMTCLLFPGNDHAAAYGFLQNLRDLFGKQRISEEDLLRLESIRQGAGFRQAAEAGGGASEEFLRGLESVVTLDFAAGATDPRALELVNKTNQFNLNGARYSQADWQAELNRPGAFLISVSYEDKFGPLGKIGVIRGQWNSREVHVLSWVLSCRAFARRIEHRCLQAIFDRFPTTGIRFAYAATPKNTPLQTFFAGLLGGAPEGEFVLARGLFEEKCPPLYQAVRKSTPEEAHVSER